MIAAGLCLMGGCFAQDTNAQAVDTYWPAHSVHMAKGSFFAIASSSKGIPLPFWEENMQAGACIENVAWTVSEPGAFCGWGRWDANNVNAAYFGPSTAGSLHYGYPTGAQILGLLTFSNADRIYNVIEAASPVARMQADLKGRDLTISTENASQTQSIPKYPTTSSDKWGGSFSAGSFECDMVSYWWRNDVVQQQFFMVQPLKTLAGDSAFFTHGFNILTEI